MDTEGNEALQELLNATGNSKWSYQNDVETLSGSINYLDRSSPITNKYCNSILNDLGSDTCSQAYDNAMAGVRGLL